MHAAADRPEFAPPPQPGLLRAFVLAVLAHLLLVAGLMHGLQWQRESENAVAEAELWSALPQEAAPREQPAPAPVPEPAPAPPQPVVKAPPPAPEPPVQRDADIVLEREKQQRELEKQKQAELEKEREERRRKLEAQKKREEELARRKEEERKAAEAKKKEEERRLAEAKQKEEERKRRQQEQQAKRLAELREENLRRIQGMAGTGTPTSTGTAARSSGPSGSWGAKVQARVRPNITFAEVVTGNPEAVVEVRLAPDGTIVGKRIKKSSGHKGWDEAVLRALEKTEVLPRDTDGTVPRGGDLVFKPKG